MNDFLSEVLLDSIFYMFIPVTDSLAGYYKFVTSKAVCKRWKQATLH